MTNNTWRPAAALALLMLMSGCERQRALPAGFQGTVEFEEFRLGFEFPGRVADVPVSAGDHVAAGALLAVLDDSLERASRAIRDHEVAAAKERVKLLEAGPRQAERHALSARIRAATALEEQLRRNLTREKELLQGGATPLSVVEDLQSQKDRATAQREELEQNLRLLTQGARSEEIAQAEAQAEATEAVRSALDQRLQHYRLLAPVSGEVLSVYAEAGEVVAAAAPVVVLADTSRPYADVYVPGATVPGLSLGQAMRVRVDGLAGPLSGRIEHFAQQVEFTPRFLFSEEERPNLVIRVRVRISDPERQLRAGIPAFVTVGSDAAAADTGGTP